jgi:uncharacterized membrane protein
MKLSCIATFVFVFISLNLGLNFLSFLLPPLPTSLSPSFLSTAYVSTASAATLIQDQITTSKAQVLKIDSSSQSTVLGTNTPTIHQTLEVKVLEGADAGQIVTFDNDYTPLKIGDLFYLIKTVRGEDGQIYYAVGDPYRLDQIYFFVSLFILLVIIFGGRQGIRGLASLAGSLILILYVLLPGILHGYSPVLVAIAVSSLIILVGSYITHGFNKTTSAAVAGMIVTIILTAGLAYYAVHSSHLTGYNSEEVVYLNLDSRGSIDLIGLLLGGMLIGILGVLYDAAIGQAISVEELHCVAPHLSRSAIYKRAIRIGREHIGALVNTLAIAYVGVSLPILLLFSKSSSPISQIINRENFATEILRALIGSIGLILAVPITTLLAIFILIKTRPRDDWKDTDKETLQKEEMLIEKFKHTH